MVFEAYRDLIRMKSFGIREAEALDLAEKESVEIRAALRVAAAQSIGHPHSKHRHSHKERHLPSRTLNLRSKRF